MLYKLLTRLKNLTGNDQAPYKAKRKHARRACDKCVSVINGQTYPIENWSMGGVLVHADSRLFAVDNEVDLTMRFKLRDDVLDIPHRGRVIRKSKHHVALQFAPAENNINDQFQHVIDDFVASQFAGSQTIQ